MSRWPFSLKSIICGYCWAETVKSQFTTKCKFLLHFILPFPPRSSQWHLFLVSEPFSPCNLQKHYMQKQNITCEEQSFQLSCQGQTETPKVNVDMGKDGLTRRVLTGSYSNKISCPVSEREIS